MVKQLTAQELIFAKSYLKGNTAPEAARTASYAETTAVSKASTWVSESGCPENKRHLLAYIDKVRQTMMVNTQIDAESLLIQLQDMRIADYADIIDDETGCFKKINDWPLIWRQMIDGLEVKEIFERDSDGNNQHIGNLHKVKFVPRAQIMKMFGEHVNIKGFQKEVHQHLHLHQSPERLTAGRERALTHQHTSSRLGVVIDVEASVSIDKPDFKRLTRGRGRTVNYGKA